MGSWLEEKEQGRSGGNKVLRQGWGTQEQGGEVRSERKVSSRRKRSLGSEGPPTSTVTVQTGKRRPLRVDELGKGVSQVCLCVKKKTPSLLPRGLGPRPSHPTWGAGHGPEDGSALMTCTAVPGSLAACS